MIWPRAPSTEFAETWGSPGQTSTRHRPKHPRSSSPKRVWQFSHPPPAAAAKTPVCSAPLASVISVLRLVRIKRSMTLFRYIQTSATAGTAWMGASPEAAPWSWSASTVQQEMLVERRQEPAEHRKEVAEYRRESAMMQRLRVHPARKNGWIQDEGWPPPEQP